MRESEEGGESRRKGRKGGKKSSVTIVSIKTNVVIFTFFLYYDIMGIKVDTKINGMEICMFLCFHV